MNLGDPVQAGRFTSSGSSVVLPLPPEADSFFLYNRTNWGSTANPGELVEARWHRGMAAGEANLVKKENSADTVEYTQASSNGFELVDTANQALSVEDAVSVTGITDADPPVVSTGTTTGLVDGDTVRLIDTTAALQLAGMEFTIDTIVASTSFNLAYMIAPGDTATGGSYRKVKYPSIYSPRRKFVANITQASQAVVDLTVTHDYAVGEKVKFFNVGALYGMTEINGLVGEITAVNTSNNSITVDIDSSGFSSWSFPGSSDYPFSHAIVVPEGEVPTITSAANTNQSKKGILLGSEVVGSNNDVIDWVALKARNYRSSVDL